MADIFTPKKRSQIMAAISGKETKPEIAVRSFLFRQGFRFRKNVKKLPGSPDVVLPKYKTVIFIHGCFWHGHDCRRAALPTSNSDFWAAKIQGNVIRDAKVCEKLHASGWNIITIWSCQLKSKIEFNETMERIATDLKKDK